MWPLSAPKAGCMPQTLAYLPQVAPTRDWRCLRLICMHLVASSWTDSNRWRRVTRQSMLKACQYRQEEPRETEIKRERGRDRWRRNLCVLSWAHAYSHNSSYANLCMEKRIFFIICFQVLRRLKPHSETHTYKIYIYMYTSVYLRVTLA